MILQVTTAMHTRLVFHETRVGFGAMAPWLAWAADNPWLGDTSYIERLVGAIRAEGCDDPILGHQEPHELVIAGTNYRETITSHGTNSRLRAVLLEARDCLPREAAVYAPESITEFARRLRTMFQRFVGSEYMPEGFPVSALEEVRHEDVQALSFPDASVDGYISCEILEHVPSITGTLSEARRVLRPGGVLIATFPFTFDADSSVHKSRVTESGRVEHLGEPEFHGNPIGGGSLVFTIPGWEIVAWCRAAGFRDARMVVHASRRYGITGAELAAVFVLKAFA